MPALPIIGGHTGGCHSRFAAADQPRQRTSRLVSVNGSAQVFGDQRILIRISVF
jgi:hypothetical protein